MKAEHDQVRADGFAPRAASSRHQRAAARPSRGDRQPRRWQTWRATFARPAAVVRPVLCVARR
jgi:hypothetical protein